MAGRKRAFPGAGNRREHSSQVQAGTLGDYSHWRGRATNGIFQIFILTLGNLSVGSPLLMENNKENRDPQKLNQDFSEDEITQSLTEEQLSQGESEGEPLSETQKLELKLKEIEDKHLRLYAEFENYRKRVAKEKEDIAFVTTQRIFENILEIRDHLEMALSHSKEDNQGSLKQGVELTLRKMDKFFETFQVKEIDPAGSTFDPNFHEAIQQEPSLTLKPGQIVRVFQKGYVFRDRLLRPARVSVAQ